MHTTKIEFFHDPICSFCFPMSNRMRELKKQLPHVEILHRSFALVKSEKEFEAMFGSHENAKNEILTHWEKANRNDNLNRFNIQGMRNATFLFPTSMPALYACKAARLAATEEAYWDVFDALQKAFFMGSQNIGDFAVIEQIVSTLEIDFEHWKSLVTTDEVKQRVENELQLVNHYGIRTVPSLVVNEKHIISGALQLEELIDRIGKVERN